MRPENLKFLGMELPDQGGKHKNDTPVFFPLITVMQRNCQPSRIFLFITNLYPIFQIILTSLWPHFWHQPKYWEELLINIFFFHTMSDDETLLNALNIVILIISYVSSLISILTFTFYRFKKLAIRPLLFVDNFFLHAINPILMIPLGFKFGDSVYRFGETKNYLYILYAVLTFLVWCLTMFFMSVMYFYDAYSIYIADSTLMTFDGFYQPVMMIAPSILMAFSFILPMIHIYLEYVVIALHIILSIVFIYWTTYLPFGSPNINILVSGLYCGALVSDIACYTSLISSWIKVIICFGSTMISICINYLFYKKYYFPKILKQKDSDNPSICLFVMRYAIMTKNSIITSGEIVEKLSKIITDSNDRVIFAKFLCYFQEYQPHFVAQMATIRKASNLTKSNQFILYQLKKLEIGRQRTAKFEELYDISNEINNINYKIKNIWNNLSNNPACVNLFSDIESITSLIIKFHHKFNELISQYPNNSILSEQYSYFLIECEANFIQAAEWQTKSVLLQEGKTFEYDDVVVHFLKFYPCYAKILLPKVSLTNLDDLDQQVKLDSIESLIQFPKLRIEMQKASEEFYLLSIFIFLIFSVISFILIVVFWILYYSLLFNDFDIGLENVESIILASNMTDSIAITSIPAMFDALSSFGLMPSYDFIQEVVASSRIYHEYSLYNFSNSYLSILTHYSNRGLNNLNMFYSDIIQQIINGANLDKVLESFFSGINVSRMDFSQNFSERYIEVPLQNIYINFFKTFRQIGIESSRSWLNNTVSFNAFSSGRVILETMDFVITSIINNFFDVFSQFRLNVWKLTISSAIIFFVVSIPSQWICYFYIRNYFSKVQKKLLLFNSSIMNKGASNIILNSKNHLNDEDSGNFSSVKNYSLKLLIVSTFLSIVVIVCLVLVLFVYQSSQDSLTNKGEIIHYTSFRACLSLELLYSIVGICFFNFIDSSNTEYYEYYTLVFNNINKYNLLSNNLDYGNDEFSKEIYRIRSEQKCSNDSWIGNMTEHEILACLSMDSALTQYIDMSRGLESHIFDPKILNTTDFINFMHLETDHLFYDLKRIPELVFQSAKNVKSNFSLIISILGVFSIIVGIIIFEINFLNFNFLIKCHKSLIAFISRIPPQDLVLNTKLIDMLLNVNHIIAKRKSPLQAIIFDSNTPVAFVNREMRVEAVNTSFVIEFGYDSNFVNGQRIDFLIKDKATIATIETLKYRNISEKTLFNVSCIKENQLIVQIDITVIPIYENTENKKLITVALVLIDKTKSFDESNIYDRIRESNNNLNKAIYAEWFNLINNYIPSMNKAICFIKFQGFQNGVTPSRSMAFRQKFIEKFQEILKIYNLLSLVYYKNGVFCVISSGSYNPSDLIIECLNFSFSISAHFENESTWGNFISIIGMGNEMLIELTNEEIQPKLVCSGDIFTFAENILYQNNIGKIIITEEAYHLTMQHDLVFTKIQVNERDFYIVDLTINETVTEPGIYNKIIPVRSKEDLLQ